MNFLLIAFLALMILNMIDGYKKGMVKQIISLVSLIVLSAVVLLLGAGITSYTKGETANAILAFVLLSVVGIVHQLLGIVFFSAKVISKLPIVHWLDKLLGIVAGVLETVLILWTVYTFAMMMNMGMVNQLIIDFTKESSILVWFYEHNYLAYFMETISSKITVLPLSLESFTGTAANHVPAGYGK